MDEIEREKERLYPGRLGKLELYLTVTAMIVGFTLTYMWWDIVDWFRRK